MELVNCILTYARGLHAARGVDGVPEQTVARHLKAHHACAHRTCTHWSSHRTHRVS